MCVMCERSPCAAGWQWTWPKASSAGGSERMQIYLGAVADLQMNLQRFSLSFSAWHYAAHGALSKFLLLKYWQRVPWPTNRAIRVFCCFSHSSQIKLERGLYFAKLLTSWHDSGLKLSMSKQAGYNRNCLYCSGEFRWIGVKSKQCDSSLIKWKKAFRFVWPEICFKSVCSSIGGSSICFKACVN